MVSEPDGREPRLVAPDRVQSVQRASRILRIIAESPAALSVREVADLSGINRSIVHRLLRTLKDSDFVAEDPPSRFAIGSFSLVLGHAFVDRLAMRRAALPYLIDLSNRFIADRPWVVSLGMPLRTEAVLIDRIWPGNAPLNGILDIGTRLSFDASAHGRCMLATFADDEIANRIGDDRFAQVHDRVEQIRGQSYIEIATDEIRPGISAVAAAIRGANGEAVGSIGISGIELAGELHVTSELATQVHRTARTIGSALPGAL